MQEFVPGFDAVGLRVEMGDKRKLEKLLKSIWATSDNYPCVSGECGAYGEDYLRIWSQLSADGLDQVLEGNPMAGMVAHVESFADDTRCRLWVWDREDQEAEEPQFPLCARTPHSWFPDSGDMLGDRGPASVTVIGRTAEFFGSEADLKAHPELGRFASASVIPVGLFADEGGAAPEGKERPVTLVVGTVLLAVRSKNLLSSDYFHALRVRTLGGEVDVLLPDEAVSGDVNHKIVAVQGLTSVTFPDWIPDALPEDAQDGPALDDATTMARVRELSIAFFDDAESSRRFLSNIHVGPEIPTVLPRYQKVAREGAVVMAHIVMANTMVLYEGKSAPALVVIAFGDGADKAMAEAREVLARVHFSEPENDKERELAALIADETYRFGHRRRLPEWLVGDVEAYAADLWIPGEAAFEDGLLCEALPVLAEPGEKGLTSPIPTNTLLEALGRPLQPVPEPTPRSGCGPLLARVFKFVKLAVISCVLIYLALTGFAIYRNLNAPKSLKSAQNSVRSGSFPSGDGTKALEISREFIQLHEATAGEDPMLSSTHTFVTPEAIILLVRVPIDATPSVGTSIWTTAQAAVKKQLPDRPADTPLSIGFVHTDGDVTVWMRPARYTEVWHGTLSGDASEKKGDREGVSLRKHF